MEDLVEIHRGAEAIIYMGRYLGLRAIYKYRPPKPYRARPLDERIRRERTINEARVMIRLSMLGIPVPPILDLDPDAGLIVMGYIDGKLLRDVLAEKGSFDLCRRAGEILGMIHMSGIYHGDPTVSNYIVSNDGDLWIIDFGLSGYSDDVEDYAVDLHLLYRSIETLPLGSIEDLKRAVAEGYRRALGVEKASHIERRVGEIRLRGRYVAMRRLKTVWRG